MCIRDSSCCILDVTPFLFGAANSISTAKTIYIVSFCDKIACVSLSVVTVMIMLYVQRYLYSLKCSLHFVFIFTVEITISSLRSGGLVIYPTVSIICAVNKVVNCIAKEV